MTPRTALVLLIAFLTITFPIIAQPPRPADAYLLQDDRLVAIDSTGQSINTVDLTPLTRVHSARTDQIDRRVFWNVADIDPTGRYLYRIEAWGRSTNRRMPGAPTSAELVRIDLETNAREVMLDNASVFNFVLSPDGERMVVFFYAGEYMYSVQQACVLSFDTGLCVRVDLERVSRSAFWVDNQQFILGNGQFPPLKLINSDTNQITPLNTPSEWYIYWATTIPNTEELLINVHPRELSGNIPANSFLNFDIKTGESALLPYKALDSRQYLTIDHLELSPNADYLLYSGLNTALVHFQTGELIREFMGPHQFGWIDDHILLVQRRPERGEREVMRVDARSGSVETVLTGAAAEGMLLFP